METPAVTPPPASTPVVPPPAFGTPSAKQQSWGTIVSLLIIIGMVVIGAFYAWGKRIAETRTPGTIDTSTSTVSY